MYVHDATCLTIFVHSFTPYLKKGWSHRGVQNPCNGTLAQGSSYCGSAIGGMKRSDPTS